MTRTQHTPYAAALQCHTVAGQRVLLVAPGPLRQGVQDAPAGPSHGARGGRGQRAARADRGARDGVLPLAVECAASRGPPLAAGHGQWPPPAGQARHRSALHAQSARFFRTADTGRSVAGVCVCVCVCVSVCVCVCVCVCV